MKNGTNRTKREEEPMPCIKKKLRSKISRRRRCHISPILRSSFNFDASGKNSGLCDFSVDSSTRSYIGGEVSVDSSRVSVGLVGKAKAKLNLRKRKFADVKGSGNVIQEIEKMIDEAPFRRITRSYYRKKESEGKEETKVTTDREAEVSESSCVESSSIHAVGDLGKLNTTCKTEKNVAQNEGSEAVMRSSELSCVEQISSAVSGENFKSNAANVECCSVTNFTSFDPYEAKKVQVSENRALKIEFPYIPRYYMDETDILSKSDSTIDKQSKSFGYESDLACPEQLSYENISVYSSSQALSELQSEIFHDNSDLDFSDYTPSIFFDSGSQFSERSDGDLTPSLTFSMLIQYREEFSRSTTSQDVSIAAHVEEEYKDQSTFLKFENEEDEESYQMLRSRERRQVFSRDYGEKYCSTMQYGDLILQQRSDMVHWIIEESTTMDLHHETIFLGVGLLDQFLNRGFFKNKRNFQILGIACLTLAIRIEENQPYNSVRRKNFNVGESMYSRCEVVGMEWLLEEVLKFQCFLPTVYNFLWFYLKAARADTDLEKRAKYLAVLVLSDHVQMCYGPSTIAAAVVILASLGGNQDDTRNRVIETHVRTKTDELHECIESLEWLLKFL